MVDSGRVVLAYSGGLDTSIILHWLASQGHEVIAYTANLGQNEDLDEIREKAERSGAAKVYIDDVRDEFAEDYVFPLLRSSAVYEGNYMLGSSIARPLTARRQVEVALAEEATHLAHGATSKGNDQFRFEVVYQSLAPDLEVIAPWRDPEFTAHFGGRPEAVAYARRHGIPLAESAGTTWSMDENLMHTSYEAGELEDPAYRPVEEMFKRTVAPRQAPDREALLEIAYEGGDPIRVRDVESGHEVEGPLPLYQYIDRVAGRNAIGRADIVESRLVGIKSRGVYESPAATVLRAAHRALEHLTMDREVMLLRDSQTARFAQLVYYGLWYSPEARVLRRLFDASQEHVTGTVTLALYRGTCTVVSRESPVALYDEEQASMDRPPDYGPGDATGFIRMSAIRLASDAKRSRERALDAAAG